MNSCSEPDPLHAKRSRITLAAGPRLGQADLRASKGIMRPRRYMNQFMNKCSGIKFLHANFKKTLDMGIHSCGNSLKTY